MTDHTVAEIGNDDDCVSLSVDGGNSALAVIHLDAETARELGWALIEAADAL
jgi:hypothetical protein